MSGARVGMTSGAAPPIPNSVRPATSARRVATPRRAIVLSPDFLMKLMGAVVMTSVWRFQDVVPGFSGLKLPLLLNSITIAALLFDMNRERSFKSLKSSVTWLLILFCGQLIFAASQSINVARSRSFLLHDIFWTIVAFILVTCIVRRVRDLRWLIGINVLGAATYSFFVLLRFRALDGLGRLCCTPYYDANDVSLVLVSTIPYLFFFLRDDESPRVRNMAIAALLVILPVFQLAGSRGGFIGLMVVVLIGMFAYKGIKPKKRIWSVVTAMVALFVLGGPAYREKVISIFRPEDDYNMTDEEGRIAMWKAAIALTKQRPMAGFGPRSFGEAYGTYSERALLRGGIPWRAAHNAYVELAAENGVVAPVVFIVLLFTGIGISWRIRLRAMDPRFGTDGRLLAMLAQSNAIGIVGYVVSSIFLSSEYLTIIYLMLGMTAVLAKLMAGLEKQAGPARVGGRTRPTFGRAQARMPQARPAAPPAPPAPAAPPWPARA